MQLFFDWLLHGSLVILGLSLLLALLRLCLGKRFSDCLLGMSMAGTITLLCAVLLSIVLGADYILDIAMALALLSFLAIVVLSRVFQKEGTEEGGSDA